MDYPVTRHHIPKERKPGLLFYQRINFMFSCYTWHPFVIFLRELHVPFILPSCFNTRIIGEEYKLLSMIFLQIPLNFFLLFAQRLWLYVYIYIYIYIYIYFPQQSILLKTRSLFLPDTGECYDRDP